MGTQGSGRKRLPNRERLTAEDDALNQIARESGSFLPTGDALCPLDVEGSQANIRPSSAGTPEQRCRLPSRVCLSFWEKPQAHGSGAPQGQQSRGGVIHAVTTVRAAESRLCPGAGRCRVDLPSQLGSQPRSPRPLPGARRLHAGDSARHED
ncbi:unnamed protein product [Rangifer tarandus platyrhynchus]|uniref:Uncharacterized protein n=1 Tax=Rangifer tarandus platyrhynchus TaxID=3082113 RepID=A0ABN8XU85_RANTA|nr:unnamed protein product [Rangifer tarandus platyrhynchus]